MLAGVESSELKNLLAESEAQLSRLSKTVEDMKRQHDSNLGNLQAQTSAQERSHQTECDNLRNKALNSGEEAERFRNALLKERRRYDQLEREAAGGVTPSLGQIPADAIAPHIASLEVEELRSADPDKRAALKKRLLLKWHPDKCINSELAKCVLQEMQQCPEWGTA